jgi:PKD repeat protein
MFRYYISPVLTFALFLNAFIFASFAQSEKTHHCGTDEMHQQLFVDRPDLNPGIIRSYEKLKAFTEAYAQQPAYRDGEPYIIPVVFHIIHNNGIENISDAQVLDAVKQVNIQFRKLNPDTTEIVDLFKDRAADAQIELRLAQLDPNGNCTSGITRTVSSLTNIGDHQVKSLIHWPSDKYLNVYICKEAAGLAGHALLPSAADTIPAWDGIVMQHSYIGTFGTSEYFRRTVLSHEIGHYLNLQHIWGGNNVPDYYYLPVAQASNCNFDDEVDDTPLTIGWQSCNLSGTSCGDLDNVQNYMDYAYCARMFTEGQKTRMHACLNSSIAGRNNLWSASNLAATGTDDVTFYLCTANFDADKRVACVGETIALSDLSLHGISSRTWSITGPENVSSTDSLANVTFSLPGNYTVALSVTNGSETLEKTLENYLTILPASGQTNGTIEDFESEASVSTRWVIVPKSTPYHFEVTEDYGFKSNQSFFLNNYDAALSTVYEFVSQPIDASALSAAALSFDWAYAQKTGGAAEILQISVSNDCGETWNVRKSYFGSSSLKTVNDPQATAFFPADSSQWKSDVLGAIPASYLTNNLQFKFRFDAKAGNNLLIDNISIGLPSALELQELFQESLHVYPNPAGETVHISVDPSLEIEEIWIVDLLGNVVVKKSVKSAVCSLHTDEISAGLYLVKVKSNQGEFTQALVIQ